MLQTLRQGPSTAPDIKAAPYKSYRHRPIRFIEFWEPAPEWGLKIYGINADPARDSPSTILDPSFLLAAKSVVVEALKRPELSSDAVHKAGYMIIHQGLLGNWLLLDWWSHDVLWNQFLFRSETVESPDFAPVTSGIIACIWEVSLMAFERDAWVRLVLQAGQGVDRQEAIGAYHKTRFNGDV